MTNCLLLEEKQIIDKANKVSRTSSLDKGAQQLQEQVVPGKVTEVPEG